MASADLQDRVIVARIAAAERWGREPDRTAATAPARVGRRAKLAREVDPDGTMSTAEVERRVDQLMQAHMLRMTRLAAQSRRKSRELAAEADAAEAELEAVGGELDDVPT